ncbi:MAG TPA: radical SAM protein [Ruminococcus flavefaciens]|nr:radical SAM protein [Ruminococcus flavefaciens]
MKFASGINRPPYETADGYLQTTEGCSHNHCLFCTYFKDRQFRKSTIEEIEADIKQIPMYFGAPKRIFLQGADGFAADYDVLMKTAELLHKYVPSVETIGGYARIDNFYDKTEQQLRDMAEVGFANSYIGVESGDDAVLKRINKGYTVATALHQRLRSCSER